MAAVLDHAGQVDARHHGELAHHRPAAGDGQGVLVVQRAVADAHLHVAFGQPRLVERLHAGTVTAVVLVDQNGTEHGSHLLVIRPIVYKLA
ncbi:hypothetical protein D3C81_2151460 [compost metagenome]